MAIKGIEVPLTPDVFRALWQHTTDLIAILDEDGSVRYVSPSYERTLGRDMSEFLGRPFTVWLGPSDRTLFTDALNHVCSDPASPATIELQLRHADGSRRVVEATISNHLDEPVLHGFVINARDVTDRVRTQELLQAHEAQYRHVFDATMESLVITNMDGIMVETNSAAHALYGYDEGELIGKNILVLVDPATMEHATGQLQDIEHGPVSFEILCRRKDGSQIIVEGRATLFMYRGQPHMLSMAHDITERVRSYELLEQRVEERTRELRTLLDVSRNVASTLEVEPLLQLVLDQLQSVVQSDSAALLIVEGDDLMVLARRSPGGSGVPYPTRYPAIGHGVIWEMLRRGESVIIDDVQGEDALARLYQQIVGDHLRGSLQFERSFLAVPMMIKDRIVGVLGLACSQPCCFTPHHAALAQAIGQQAAIAIENARLYERAQEVAVLEERQRLSRELHDSVSQALYGIALGTQTARAQLDRDPAAAAGPLDYVLAQAQAGLTEMRALLLQLRPEALETEGLTVALQRQAAALQARSGVAVPVRACAEPDIPLAVKEALFRIAQEALHNAAKHSGADLIEAILEQSAEGMALFVRDNGKGFDPLGDFPGHLGLHTMRERAARVGGKLEVRSAPGEGTEIAVMIPIEAATR